jgi:hypothetical protein
MNQYIDTFSQENLIDIASDMDAKDFRSMLEECKIEYNEIYVHDHFDPNDGVFHILVKSMDNLEIQYVKGELEYAGDWITK